MTLYYSPVTGQTVKAEELWKLYRPVKSGHTFKEFCDVMGYRKMDVAMMEKRIAAQNALIHLLFKRMKVMSIRLNVQDLVKNHEYSRSKRRF